LRGRGSGEFLGDYPDLPGRAGYSIRNLAIGWAWVAFWIYWLASAAGSKQSVRAVGGDS
jgi:hypothetical protein